MDTPHINRERARLAIKLRAAADWLDNGGPHGYDLVEAHALILQAERGITQLRQEADHVAPQPRSDRGQRPQPAIQGSDMYLGDTVETYRTGAGQPYVKGTLVEVIRDLAIIQTTSGIRKRTVTMLRKVT
jgi:sRNA-binding protein